MISIKDLSFQYESGSKIEKDDDTSISAENRGIHDIDLEIKKGECILLCGRSGCGKSTMIKILAGLIPRYHRGELSGEIWIGGIRIDKYEMYELSTKVGIVFQNPRTQFFNVDVNSEIVFGMENLGFDPEYMRSRRGEVIRDLKLEEITDNSIFDLSGGEKQRVAFASVYALNPDIYLLDEPSSNLDEYTIEKLAEFLRLIKDQGKTIIVAEHRLYYLMDIVDRVIYMDDGKIKQIYTSNEFKEVTPDEMVALGLRTKDIDKVKLHIDSEMSNYSAVGIDLGASDDLVLRDISLYQNKRLILSGINISAKKGEIIAITGRNGIGKTTLIRTLCGLHNNYEGEIIVRGKKLKNKDRRKLSYIVMQDVGYQLFAENVEKECSFGLDNYDPSEVDRLLQHLKLYEYRDNHPNTLSGGQKQRLAIITACISNREILAFDEPTSGLDYDSMISMSTIIKEIARDRLVFVITHDYEFIQSTCTRVIRL